MIAVLRISGVGLILTALAAAMFDATRSAETWGVAPTSLGDAWGYVHAQSLASARLAVQKNFPTLWDHGLQTIPLLPSAA